MTTNSLTHSQNPVRASDAEREEVARLVQAAGGAGRLTMTETEERLAGIYAARFRHELSQFTEDLPDERARTTRPWPSGSRRPLAIHAAIVAVLAIVLIVRWAVSGVPYFFPAFPLFWMAVSVVVHARIRGVRWRRQAGPTTA
jgi:hypothetical protein